jgi:membrane-associated phospholipid phosphatase
LAGTPGLDQVMIAISVLGVVHVTALGVVPLWFSGKREEAFDFLVLLLVDWGLTGALKSIFLAPRPEIGTRLYVPLTGATTHSFPSGHVSRAFSVATFLSARFRTWNVAVPLFAYAVLMGISRMYVGVHWPTDVLAGAVIGSLLGLGFSQAVRWEPYAAARKRIVELIYGAQRRLLRRG